MWVWVSIGIVVVVILAFIVLRLTSKAARLDRLHRRMDGSRVSLDNALLLRASVASEVAGNALPDPGTAIVIAEAAREARRAATEGDEERGLAESNLTQVLAAAFDEAESIEECNQALDSAELMSELDSATRRVEMSRRFLNDAVRACAAVREQNLVELFHLAGHTPWPTPFEMDDTPPAGFGIR